MFINRLIQALRRKRGGKKTANELASFGGDCVSEIDQDLVIDMGEPEEVFWELPDFLNFIIDFLKAPPETFRMPPENTYTKGTCRRIIDNIPAFRECFEKMLGQATGEIAYFAVSVRWPYHFQNFREEGFQRDFANHSVAILPGGHPGRMEYDSDQMVTQAIHIIRNAFEYGEFGVFLIGIPAKEADKYFEFENDGLFVSPKRDVLIPPEYILDLVSGPRPEEKEDLEAVLRAYWSKLDKMGYKPEPYYWEKSVNICNPLYDKIPSVLKKDGVRIGLGTNWEARGILEATHRICVINKIIENHKQQEEHRVSGLMQIMSRDDLLSPFPG